MFTFKSNAVNQALAEGLTPTSMPKYYQVLGPTVGNYECTSRQIAVSFVEPPLYADENVQIWINAETREVFKSSNFYSRENLTWLPIMDYDSIFQDDDPISTAYAAAALSGTSTSGGSSTTISPDVATKAYVLSLFNQLVSSGSNSILPPVSTIADLRALDVTAVQDKQLIFVEQVNSVYAYDAQSALADTGNTVIAPTTGTGRWICVTPANLNGGTF